MPVSLSAVVAFSPLAAAVIVLLSPAMARWIAATSLAISLGAALTLAPGIGHAPMILFAALALATVLSLPRQDAAPAEIARLLFTAAGALTVYAAANPWLMLAGYLAAMLPFLEIRRLLASLLLAASCVAVAAAIWSGEIWLLILAIALAKGLFPLQSSIMAQFERSALGTAALFFNAHLGAFLLIRFAGPAEAAWLPVVGTAALVASVFTALIAVVETRPRQILALVASSQAAFILAGLSSATPQGVQGALMQWIVVGIASTGMLTVYRLIEVRYGRDITGRDFLGLAERFPRLGVAFAVCALAMVGLPGTLGFLAEDLLVHGLLATHPYVGMLQPLAAAINAFTLLRLFSTLFLGRRVSGLDLVPDAIPRERWPLAALVLLLVLGGFVPGYVASLGEPATNAVTATAARP